MLSLIVSTAVIGAAWFRHRPRLVILLAMCLGGGYAGVAYMGKKHRDAHPPPPPLEPAPTDGGGAIATAETCASFGACPPTLVAQPLSTPCATTPCTWKECCVAGTTCSSFGECPPGMAKRDLAAACTGKYCTWQECCLSHVGA
eukprot:TRINITY_DN5379_c0_g1_i1.p3 TRINITY_DN5379_c0_g1~~TRINITY_DN5379_c0_g1_i1.p3  ORF type:complete len:144 (-),score=31.31 TRINITY_DN5379_c0_g1_i1:58-489(-)